MAHISSENLGLLHNKVTITLSKEDYLPKVNEGLKRMSKTAQIKGFRQGMVPVGMVKKMYGREVLADELSKSASEKLDNYIKESKIKFLGHPLSLPMTQEIDINNETDYQFVFEMGLQPEFSISMPNNNIPSYKIKIDDELITKEMSYEQTRHGKSEETETIEKEDIVALEVKAEGFEKNIHLLVSTIKNAESQSQIMNMKKDESVVFDFNKAFDNDEEMIIHKVLNVSHDEFHQLNASALNITLTKIHRLVKAEVNTAFFDKVYAGKGITTEEAFKTELRKDLEAVYERETNRKANTDLRDYMVKNTAMEFPKEFLTKWIKSVSKTPMTDEEVEKGYESFAEDLKWTLIKNRIVVEGNLQITDEDIRNKVMEYLREAYKGMDDMMLNGIAERILSNEKETEYMVDQLINERVFESLRSKVNFDTKEITLEEFEKLTHHGHHH